MTFKEFLISRVQLFFFLVTLIFAVSMILGLIFTPEQELHYYQLIGPFLIAALCVLTTFVSYFRKEPSVWQLVLRHSIQLILIELVVVTQITPPVDGNPMVFRIILGAVVFAIYLLASLMLWLQKYIQSKKLTEQLKKLQQSNS